MNEQAVVVTGASTGIGRATALHLDALSFRVFAGVRNQKDGDALRRLGSALLEPMILDVTDPESIDLAGARVRTAVQDSRLLGIVNNAGIVVGGPLEFLAPDDLTRQFDVNVVGQLRVTQVFMPLLREGHGRIVFMSSLAGRLSQPIVGAYAASKHALEALADALRIEVAPWGIGVAIVEPGAVATPIWGKSLRAADAAAAMAPSDLRRLYGDAIEAIRRVALHEAEHGVPPEDVARAVEHALTAPRPRTRYVVGRDARIALTLKRFLPDRLMDRLIVNQVKLPTTAPEARAAHRGEGVPAR